MEPSAIDPATFGELREAVGDEFAFELVDTFLEETPGIISEMRSALETFDADGYRRAAHSLKSNGKTFGALPFAELARDAELGGIVGDPEVEALRIDAIDAAYAAAAAELRGLHRG